MLTQKLEEGINRAISHLATVGVEGLTAESLLGKVQSASAGIEEELTVMSATMAYFMVRVFIGHTRVHQIQRL